MKTEAPVCLSPTSFNMRQQAPRSINKQMHKLIKWLKFLIRNINVTDVVNKADTTDEADRAGKVDEGDQAGGEPML